MRSVDPELQEIEQLGEESFEEEVETRPKPNYGSGLFVLQGVVSVLLLLALAVCKWKVPLTYEKICSWYCGEIEREISLPHWSGFAAETPESGDTLQNI